MWAVIAFVLLLGSATPARAELLARPSLHFVRASGAESCVSPPALARMVEEVVGPVLVSAAQASASVEVQVLPMTPGPGFAVRLYTLDADGVRVGERTLGSRNANCRALDAGLAFIIALTIDPDANPTAEMLAGFTTEFAPEQALLDELEKAPPKPVAVAAEPRPRAVPIAPLALPRDDSPPWALDAGIDAAFGLLPHATWGASLGLGHRLRSGIVVAADLTAFPGSVAGSVDDTRQIALTAYAAAIAVCPVAVTRATLQARACLAADVARLEGTGRGFATNQRDTLWDPGVALQARMGVALGERVVLYLQWAGRLRASDQRFVFQEAAGTRALAYEPDRFAQRLTLGASYAY